MAASFMSRADARTRSGWSIRNRTRRSPTCRSANCPGVWRFRRPRIRFFARVAAFANALGSFRRVHEKSSLTPLFILLSLATAPLAIFVASAHAADNPAEVFELPSVNVVGTDPLPGLGTALRDVPANVQIFDNRLLERMRPLTLTQFLDMNANSVGAQSGQGNPFQQSLNFRGFAASPLLGTPQGISVFQ